MAAPGSGTPTGTVVFMEGKTVLGRGTLVTAGGRTYASFTTSTLATGVHTITAVYQGDAADLSSTAPAFKVTVAAPDLVPRRGKNPRRRCYPRAASSAGSKE